MNYDELSDQELLRQFHTGDNLAFTALVRRHQDAVYRLCHGWLYDQQRCDDAGQEVFLRAFQRLPRFRFRASPFTWLYRTTRLVCFEFNREPRIKNQNTDELVDNSDDDNDEYEIQLVMLRKAVQKLPARQNEVITLRVFEQKSVAETAKLMGCRQGTVKALAYKARTALQRLLPEAKS